MLQFLTPLIIAISLLALPAFAANERPANLAEGINPGTLSILQLGGEKPDNKLEMPLKHTDVNIEVSGFVASATVIQHYHNPFKKPIEAVYTFPLPNDAAVDDMQMTIGKRTIKGRVSAGNALRCWSKSGLISLPNPLPTSCRAITSSLPFAMLISYVMPKAIMN